MHITHYKVFSYHRILLLVYYVVQVVGVEPYLVTIKSRVHNRYATPAYGTEGWNRTIGNGLIRAVPSPLGYFRINVGACGRCRVSDPWFFKPVLVPCELHRHIKLVGEVGADPTIPEVPHLQCGAVADLLLSHMMWWTTPQ